jgi:hypothetical protein
MDVGEYEDDWDDDEHDPACDPLFIERLTPEHAERFRDCEETLCLYKLRDLHPEVAAILATQCDGDLDLSGLRSISDAAATHLGKHRAGRLFLNGLTSLSADSAKALAGHLGASLHLDGISCLTEEAAEGLLAGVDQKRKQGWFLSLGGVRQLSHRASEALAAFHKRGVADEAARSRDRTKQSYNPYDTEAGWRLVLDNLEYLDSPSLADAYFHHNFSSLQSVSLDVVRVAAQKAVSIQFARWQSVPEEFCEILGGFRGRLDLSSLDPLSAEEARGLARHEGELNLDGLRCLGPGVAAALSRHKGRLSLNGVESLTADDASHLAKADGDLLLDSLKVLDDAAGAQLAKNTGELSLKRVTAIADSAAGCLAVRETPALIDSFVANHALLPKLSPEKAALLARYRVDLNLDRLTHLTDEAAAELGAHVGKLSLNGLYDLSPRAAKGLAQRQGHWKLSLDGLRKIGVKAAGNLAKHPGKLTLNGLVELPDSIAEQLVDHEGWAIELNGLTVLTDSVATILASRRAPWRLSLMGLKSLSDFSRGALSALPEISLSSCARKRSN